MSIKTYTFFIDFSNSWDEGEIASESISIKAKDASHANDIAPDIVRRLIIEKELPDQSYYIWEIVESDAE